MHQYILPYFICGPSLAAHRQCTFVLHRDWTRSENQERYQRKVATPSFEAHCTTQWFFESKTTACVFFSAAAVWRFFCFVKPNFFHRLLVFGVVTTCWFLRKKNLSNQSVEKDESSKTVLLKRDCRPRWLSTTCTLR